jgi:hypothetical protein
MKVCHNMCVCLILLPIRSECACLWWMTATSWGPSALSSGRETGGQQQPGPPGGPGGPRPGQGGPGLLVLAGPAAPGPQQQLPPTFRKGG